MAGIRGAASVASSPVGVMTVRLQGRHGQLWCGVELAVWACEGGVSSVKLDSQQEGKREGRM